MIFSLNVGNLTWDFYEYEEDNLWKALQAAFIESVKYYEIQCLLFDCEFKISLYFLKKWNPLKLSIFVKKF